MNLYFNEKTKAAKDMERIAVLCAKEEKLDPGKISISVSFVSKAEIQRLNKEYRNKEKAGVMREGSPEPPVEGLSFGKTTCC